VVARRVSISGEDVGDTAPPEGGGSLKARDGKPKSRAARANTVYAVCRLRWHHTSVSACPDLIQREFEVVRRDLEETVIKLKKDSSQKVEEPYC
jgi:hypothetical protein